MPLSHNIVLLETVALQQILVIFPKIIQRDSLHRWELAICHGSRRQASSWHSLWVRSQQRCEAAKEWHGKQMEWAATQLSSAQAVACPKCSRVWHQESHSVATSRSARDDCQPSQILVCEESAINTLQLVLVEQDCDCSGCVRAARNDSLCIQCF